jgi:hypothetical protein
MTLQLPVIEQRITKTRPCSLWTHTPTRCLRGTFWSSLVSLHLRLCPHLAIILSRSWLIRLGIVMERKELKELHYITPICNIPSILQHGILSHVGVSRLEHQSVAMVTIQDRRAGVRVPGGRPLHEYVNLYICARNPMLFKRQAEHRTICVLSVTPDVLHLPGVIVTDSNASSEYVRFASAPDGLQIVDRDRTFAEYWTDSDRIQEWRKKAAKCAEVLVPDRVAPRFIIGVYVSCEEAKRQVEAFGLGLPVTIQEHLFFL